MVRWQLVVALIGLLGPRRGVHVFVLVFQRATSYYLAADGGGMNAVASIDGGVDVA